MKEFKILILCCIFLGCNITSKKTQLEGVLVEYRPAGIGCGVLSIWVGLKFSDLNGKRFVVFVQCPDAYGENYFLPGQRYAIRKLKDSIDKKRNTIINGYKNEQLEEVFTEDVDRMEKKK